jgi:hypothetical protein
MKSLHSLGVLRRLLMAQAASAWRDSDEIFRLGFFFFIKQLFVVPVDKPKSNFEFYQISVDLFEFEIKKNRLLLSMTVMTVAIQKIYLR